jgi:hypothetical protein
MILAAIGVLAQPAAERGKLLSRLQAFHSTDVAQLRDCGGRQ